MLSIAAIHEPYIREYSNSPFLFLAFTLAPALMRYSTHAGLQLSMALMRGVAPLRAGASTWHPDATSSSMMSSWPAWQAWWSGVQLNWSLAFTSALRGDTVGDYLKLDAWR